MKKHQFPFLARFKAIYRILTNKKVMVISYEKETTVVKSLFINFSISDAELVTRCVSVTQKNQIKKIGFERELTQFLTNSNIENAH